MKLVCCTAMVLACLGWGCASGGEGTSDGAIEDAQQDSGPSVVPRGGKCTAGVDKCAAGHTCVDGVCCSNPDCMGPCKSCSIPGMEGTCSFVSAGQDPKDGCAGVDCSGFYAGWMSNTCFSRAGLGDKLVGCNGSGACQTANDVCPGSTNLGPAAITCGTCTTLDAATCTGTTRGVCDAPLGVDLFEPNDACAQAKDIGGVANNESHVVTETLQIEPVNDVDTFRFVAIEELPDQCFNCPGSTMEAYRVLVYISVPGNVGTYRLCVYKDTCGTGPMQCADVSGGTTGGLGSVFLDVVNACTSHGVFPFFVQVSGTTNSHSCQPYAISFEMIPKPCT